MNKWSVQRRVLAEMLVAATCLLAAVLSLAVESIPENRVLRVCPENPRYFLWEGRPTILVASGEHYGAVMNQNFDFHKYLATLEAAGLNSDVGNDVRRVSYA